MQGDLNSCRNQSGSASLVALVAMLVLGVLGNYFISMSSTEVNMAANYRDGIAAQYLAEAGARHAIVELSKNPNWKPVNPYKEGNGEYRLTIIAGTPSTLTLIEAQGVVNHSVRKVVVKATVIPTISIVSWNYH
jgi:Tfp pilus assembly protein PilX